VQLLHVRLVHIELRDGTLNLGVAEHADLLAPCDQTLDFVKLLQFQLVFDSTPTRDPPERGSGRRRAAG
jgi:hypothetical protein